MGGGRGVHVTGDSECPRGSSRRAALGKSECVNATNRVLAARVGLRGALALGKSECVNATNRVLAAAGERDVHATQEIA
jgi:hypothetical protein